MRAEVVEFPRQRIGSSVSKVLETVTVRSTEDIHDAAVALAELARERGFRVSTCDDISSKEPMIDADGTIINGDIFGWLDDGMRWWEDHRLALHSPLPRACRYESEPFWVNADGFHTMWANSYLDEIDLRDFEKRSLCKAAIVVPIHLPFAQISANSFISEDLDKTDLSQDFALHGELLSAAVRRFVAGYVQAHRAKRRIPSDCVLSKREVECLRWAAIGKTDMEISMILERSHATIRYHIHRAGEKLNAVNRAQAIFKAGQLGYLGASE
ncbi:helix-turn-helix transcriptional regulator [Parerythrobacter jejuensis]|uniref:Helix-turn-helix transcriptional regulator n=1 Tax=Parerythrobacter jejuensis TaxID=795812 RepID=A0A845ANZ2_9SPHN|nr:LuxR C-terminal-related transcriptional regulator [Parerythrobacter jejuensis]MXP30216.1 helix-turn-helix transcriptional regulator [Parerythrobacter jejuensis]MXP32976.1 helix-turn-helix transcriptional regulator [Parerythrobacter jejuensis]